MCLLRTSAAGRSYAPAIQLAASAAQGCSGLFGPSVFVVTCQLEHICLYCSDIAKYCATRLGDYTVLRHPNKWFGCCTGKMFTSVLQFEDLKAKVAPKKKAVDPNYVPTFEDAIKNPQAAMSQVLAMKANQSPAIRGYDAASAPRTVIIVPPQPPPTRPFSCSHRQRIREPCARGPRHCPSCYLHLGLEYRPHVAFSLSRSRGEQCNEGVPTRCSSNARSGSDPHNWMDASTMCI